MKIPSILKKKVIRCFGPRGKQWLHKLPQLFERCVEQWNLTRCRNSPVMSHSYVCFAHSPDYGDVALKIAVPHNELFTEMTALSVYPGENICCLYESSQELGAMLLEKISPGGDLTTLPDRSQRIDVAADLVSRLPVRLKKSCHLPLLPQLAKKTFARLQKEHPEEAQLLGFVHKAEKLISDLYCSPRPRVLLHGDLNHWNILEDGQNGWRAIDPKGQEGVACMEAARFMINELDMASADKWSDCLEQMTAVFSCRLNEPESIINLCAFVDNVVSTCWKFEEHIQRDLTPDVQQCASLWKHYEKTLSERSV